MITLGQPAGEDSTTSGLGDPLVPLRARTKRPRADAANIGVPGALIRHGRSDPMDDGRANRAAGCLAARTALGWLDETVLAAPASAGLVRTQLRSRLADWGLLGRADDVDLIAGELLANAAQYAPFQEMRVTFALEPGGMLLRVWDCSNALPTSTPLGPVDVSPDPEALDPGHDDGTGGWGLPIVEALSVYCGVEPTPPRGKWVWSLIAC